MHGMLDGWFHRQHQDQAFATMRKKRNAAMAMMMEGSVGHGPEDKDATWEFIIEFCKAAIRIRLNEDGNLKPVKIESCWLEKFMTPSGKGSSCWRLLPIQNLRETSPLLIGFPMQILPRFGKPTEIPNLINPNKGINHDEK
ncbi:hypothetical protein SH580_06065 [Coraliomargarita algicola]|uniref:Uncharacterized protein n=1 Tax=Coraliomargarita algicola TaxID=3092156 RepID=A0ABZ0RM21_9BACT|nr:hypothetical protein [Coraliomargarita sp. J2-16]WPJ97271.1 hypothetical protein SH580_06065 [Coraliomargarita sp. J2-16]